MSSRPTRLLPLGAVKWLVSAALKTMRAITGNLALWISLAALIVSATNSYFSFFRHSSDFRVYMRLPDPSQIGTNTLDVNYFFANMGDQAVLIEDVAIGDLWIKSDKPNYFGAEIDRCNDADLMLPIFMTLTKLLPYAIWQEHKPFPGPGGTRPKEGILFALDKPVKIYIDGAEAKAATTAVEAGKMKVISATFETTPLLVADYNTAVVCPVIRIFDNKGQPVLAWCKGWEVSHPSPVVPFLPEGLPGVVSGAPLGRLLPAFNKGLCRTQVTREMNATLTTPPR
jgi:hypothetical protein